MRVIILFIIICLSSSAYSQDNGWVLTKTSGDTKVYTRKKEGEKFKEIKILTRYQTTLNTIMAAFDDTEAHKDWVFKTPESYTVEKISDNTLIYYIKSDLPFPVSDRDLVIKYKWTQDPETKIIITESVGVVGKVEEIDSNVRVKDFVSNYTLTPQQDGWIDIKYYAKMDPAGNLPAWLVNMAVTKGPIITMENLFTLLDSGKYDDVKIEGVSELDD